MMKAGRRIAGVASRLRDAGLRVTAPRVAVLEELARNRTHPNPLEVHRALSARNPSLSLSTVYLTIEAFAKAGLLRRIPARDGHLRVDGVVEEHDHAVCRHCGDVFDLPAQPSIPGPHPAGCREAPACWAPVSSTTCGVRDARRTPNPCPDVVAAHGDHPFPFKEIERTWTPN